MTKSFTVFIEDGGHDVKSHVTVTFKTAFLSHEKTPLSVKIDSVLNAETNFRISSVSEYLKKLIESEAMRVANQYASD